MSEYHEHEHEHYGEHQPMQRDGHLVVYLAWPLLAGLGLAAVLAISVGGIAGLATLSLAGAVRWAALVFFLAWGGTTVIVFGYAAISWGGPLALLRARQPVQVVTRAPVQIDEQPPMVIRGYARPPMIEASLESNIKALEPDATKEVRELYKFITTMWPTGSITQADCLARGFSRRDWDRYIGGSRRKGDVGKDSARGWLDRAGVISKEGNEWRIAASLEEALGINDELMQYAMAKSQVVKIG
jgi:hypothetical protein